MASLSRTYEKKKLLGQVYTPIHIVHKILDAVGYDSGRILGKSIIDPACGDGRFLAEIVRRVVKYSPPDDLLNNLSKVHGWDIDEKALELCKANLDGIVESTGLKVEWKIEIKDALKMKQSAARFDFIVGNPPYIRIQHLPKEQRIFLQENYAFCASGSTDTFVAFFELGDSLLNETGCCGFITPNSYFFSETARLLRKYFQDNKNLKSITNYGSLRVFDKTGTYAAITIFDKSSRTKFIYELSDPDFAYKNREIPFTELPENKLWQLSLYPPANRIGIRLGDICQISVGVTTLSDRDYLFKVVEETNGNLVKVISKSGEETMLEKEMLKPIVKASRMKKQDEAISEYILFPYKKYRDGKHTIIPEPELKKNFPYTHKYLLGQKEVLGKRDNGKKNTVAWYAFGRAQSLDTSFGEKIVFSPMNKSPKFIYVSNPEATIYSGYFIKYQGDYQKLLSVLNSDEMAAYMAVAGRDFRGGWKGYSKKIVENFRLTESQEASLK